jgi:AraC family transcriptional regulator, exoenzyme S synthesis regulatory protein ExsA
VKIYNLPDDFDSKEEHRSPVVIRSYQADSSSQKNKAILHQNMVDIIISGKKSILNIADTANFEAGDLMILAKGNCLVSEALPEGGLFSSLVLYFTNEVYMDFLGKYQGLMKGKTPGPADRKPVLVWRQDGFIHSYVASLRVFLQSTAATIPEFRQLKLEELLLYLLQADPWKFQALAILPGDDEDMRLRKAVESNVCNPVTVEELAFLCNISLSTFKRKFSKLYGTSPIKWLVREKIRIAAGLLKNPGERPGLVYEKVGYENHSSFTQAFKQQFKVTPKEYRDRNLSF